MAFIIKNNVLKRYTEEIGVVDVVIPDSVTKIGESAFEGCTSLQSITIPDGVTKIWKNAFDGCTSLVISAPAGSYAIEYAKKNKIKYVEI